MMVVSFVLDGLDCGGIGIGFYMLVLFLWILFVRCCIVLVLFWYLVVIFWKVGLIILWFIVW